MAKGTLTAPRPTRPRSDGLRNAFALCPCCGEAVLVQVAKTVTVEWHNPESGKDELVKVMRWERQDVAMSPLQPFPHQTRCPAMAALRPLWITDGQGGERFTWLQLATGELVEVAPL